MVLNDKVYDALKWLVQIFLPAAATLYAALAVLWGFPFVEQVVGTIGAVVAARRPKIERAPSPD